MLDQTKLKTFEDDKLKEPKMIISVFDRVDNIVAKGEIARHERLLSQRRQKVSLCGNGLKCLQTTISI